MCVYIYIYNTFRQEMCSLCEGLLTYTNNMAAVRDVELAYV